VKTTFWKTTILMIWTKGLKRAPFFYPLKGRVRMSECVLGRCVIEDWLQTDERLVGLPLRWRPFLHVSGEPEQVLLGAGGRLVRAQVVFTDEAEEVAVTAAVRKAIGLPLGAITAKAVEGAVQFGPFVGLYALLSQKEGPPFGGLTAVFQDMMSLARELGVGLYVFAPGDADWERGVVRAYVMGEGGCWVKKSRPLPDVVLPKIVATPPALREKVYRDREQFAERVPHGTLTAATGDKWEVHQALIHLDDVKALLPDTRRVYSTEDVEEMLEAYGAVFVKPCMGTQGRTVYRLRRMNGRVQVQYTQGGRTQVKFFRRRGTLFYAFVKKKFCGRRAFLVQQALDLLVVQGGRPVDFRWLVQKDGGNRWAVTARVARIGEHGAITTNLHTGGRARLAESFLAKHGWREQAARAALLRQMDEGALRIAAALEEKAGRICELGIDFGLTRQGDVFLIEVNPRPGRGMLRETSADARLLSLRRNLEYAMYTTGYQPASRRT
jgi:glutathione synthase/RimK-type ligase-like ATP-grasp enzyme